MLTVGIFSPPSLKKDGLGEILLEINPPSISLFQKGVVNTYCSLSNFGIKIAFNTCVSFDRMISFVQLVPI